MGKKAILILASSFMLLSCGGSNSSVPADKSVISEEPSTSAKQESAAAVSSSKTDTPVSEIDWFADWSVEERSEYEYVKYSIQIGGNIQSIPDRFWNPEAAYDKQCLVADEDDHNLYRITIELDAGDSVLFFFDYSWSTVLDFDDVDWDHNPELKDVDSYVSDSFTGEDVSNKFTEIHILKKAKYTFVYDAFGVTLSGMKTGLALQNIE